ncbi:MAG: dihydroorotase family protein, partial [Dehalococcoidia bacterium]
KCRLSTRYRSCFGTGSAAAAMGGVTCVLDMPNTKPPTADPEAVRLKQRLAEEKSWVDFGVIGLVVQDNVEQILAMAESGVVGYKCFLGETVGNIPAPDDGVLLDAMRLITQTGLRIGFHAENNSIMQHLIGKLKAEGRTDALAHVDSRPPLAEVEAIQRVALFAKYTGTKIHIYHLSSKQGVQMVAEWQDKGVDITAETGAHYCFLSSDRMKELGSILRMNPPVRSSEHGEALLQGLITGRVTMIATDHSPHTREEKLNDDIWKAISGFIGVETSVPVFLSEAVNAGNMSLSRFVRLTSYGPSRTWNLYPTKGTIRVGSDADLTIVDLNKAWEIKSEKLHSKNSVTPFDGWKGKGVPLATVVRGQLVMRNGELVGQPQGRMVRPSERREPSAVVA